jgi:cyclopropane-fatty-acyl-phospholipid synthase
MTFISKTATDLAESGLIPDSVIRLGIRRLIKERRRQIGANGPECAVANMDLFVSMMDRSDIALVPGLANEQHYELPAEFFTQVLGRHRKYSCCYWSAGAETLDEAEQAALELTGERASIANGQSILDLGCGWGSFSLWVADRYRGCSVTAVSNSASQRLFIEGQAEARGLTNLRVITADMNVFHCDERFDRIVSIEMFEHMRNYGALFARISRWLSDDGYFFMHIFCHRSAAYEYVDGGPADWMSRHFFSGGIMPSRDLPLRFQQHLTALNQWQWEGTEYQKTAKSWLKNMEKRKSTIMPILDRVYGKPDSRRWWMRWRMFFLAVGEMFGYDEGHEWLVGHYLFKPSRQRSVKEDR